MASKCNQPESEQRMESEVTALKDQVNSMQAQMLEMMKLLQAMSANAGVNASNAQPQPTNAINTTAAPVTNVVTTGIAVGTPSTSWVVEAGQRPTATTHPQNPAALGMEEHGYHD